MKTIFFISTFLISTLSNVAQQFEITKGPEIDKGRWPHLMNLVDADSNFFYAYFVNPHGPGESYALDKIDKHTLASVNYTKIPFGKGVLRPEEIMYANGRLYIFNRLFDRRNKQMALRCIILFDDGTFSEQIEVSRVNSLYDKYTDFDVVWNPSHTRFLVKASHKEKAEDQFKTDFILLDRDLKIQWTKSVDLHLFKDYSVVAGLGNSKSDMIDDLLGLWMDEKDNISFCYRDPTIKRIPVKHPKIVLGYPVTEDPISNLSNFYIKLGFIASDSDQLKDVALPIDTNYIFYNFEFYFKSPNELVIGGFCHDRLSKDSLEQSVYVMVVDPKNLTVRSSTDKLIDKNILKESGAQPDKLRYKMTHVFLHNEDLYFIGEKFLQTIASYTGGSGDPLFYIRFFHGDIIVSKFNVNDELEWIRPAPLRNLVYPWLMHCYQMYMPVLTDDSIYIFSNDNPDNVDAYQRFQYKAAEVQYVIPNETDVFKYSAISLKNGSTKTKPVDGMRNTDFMFFQKGAGEFQLHGKDALAIRGSKNEIYMCMNQEQHCYSKVVIKE